MSGSDPAAGIGRLEAFSVEGIGEVTAGTDLGALLATIHDLADGDVVLVTSKVVSKAEGRVVAGERPDVVMSETVRVVARRGPTAIVENHLGLVMAAAGVDASNVATGHLVLLPRDPDASARTMREAVLATTGRNVAVLVTDTAGRPWRHGQTDIAIGAAGLDPLTELAGRQDRHGNTLAVTAPAVADELAAAADLVAGKLSGRPVVVVRGLGGQVLPPGEHGPGARSLVRGRAEDMFGLGSREAVLAAVRGTGSADFGAPVPREEVVAVLLDGGWSATPAGADLVVVESADQRLALARVVAFAHGWAPVPGDVDGDVGHPTSRLLLRRGPVG